ncbi:MAG: hypothetical protein AAFV78_06370 [Bacteroidota bacterium]
MSTSLSYRSFFTIDLLQEYYLSEESDLYEGDANVQAAMLRQQRLHYKAGRDLSLQPTQDTASQLRNYGLLIKTLPQGVLIGGRVRLRPDESAVPFIPIDTSLVLRFSLSPRSPYFTNFTNLRMEKEPSRRDQYVYYFSNRAANVSPVVGGPDIHYLSTAIPGFEADRGYEAGEVILEGGLLREALSDLAAAPAFVGSEWKNIYTDLTPVPQFVTTADRMLLRPRIFDLPVASANQEALEILLRDRENAIVDRFTFETSEVGTPLTTCNVDLKNVDPARYTLQVQTIGGIPFPDLTLDCYVDDELYLKRPLAIIECFHEPDGSLGAYRWFDQGDDDRLLSPRYTIRWKNRSTYWRYYLPGDPTTFSSTDVEAFEISPGNTLDSVLVSTEPLSLTEVGRRLEATIDGETRLLPNPGPRILYPEGGRLYSEVNLGGGLGPPSA